MSDEDEAMVAALRDFGRTLTDTTPDGWGFTVLLFTTGADGSSCYVSSAEREDMLDMLRAMTDMVKDASTVRLGLRGEAAACRHVADALRARADALDTEAARHERVLMRQARRRRARQGDITP